jgi:hypothetical protein
MPLEIELSALFPLFERFNGMTIGPSAEAKAPIPPAPEGPASLDDLLDLLPKSEPKDQRRTA